MENNFSENVQPNQLNQPVPAQHPKKVFWIFFIASVLIAFLAGGYFLAGKQNKLIVQSQQQTATPTIVPSSPVPTIDPTANWKIYRNFKYNFELKYPNDWQNIECDENDPTYVGFSYATSLLTRCQTEGISNINVRIISKTDIMNSPGVGYSGWTLDDTIKDIKTPLDNIFQTNIILDNIPAVKIIGTTSDRDRPMSPIGSQQIHVIFSYGGNIYRIYHLGSVSTDPNKSGIIEVFDNMLSTFKFTP